MADVSVKKTGAAKYPWEVRCRVHTREKTYLSSVGAVAINTRGVGNRTWYAAMLAAVLHLRDRHG